MGFMINKRFTDHYVPPEYGAGTHSLEVGSYGIYGLGLVKAESWPPQGVVADVSEKSAEVLP